STPIPTIVTRHRRPILDILDRFGRVIGCEFLNSLTLSLILGLQKAREWARRVEGFAFGSTDFILSRTSNIPSGPSLSATSLSTSNTQFSSDSFPFRNSGSMSSTCPGEKRTGFEIIQPVALRLNFPQRTALYQNDMSKNSASSRVSWRSASSSGLGPVLILSNPLNR